MDAALDLGEEKAVALKPVQAGGVGQQQVGLSAQNRHLLGVPTELLHRGVGNPGAVRGKHRVHLWPPPVAVSIAPTVSAERLKPACLASPKSRILACPRLVTKMFAGLMSR